MKCIIIDDEYPAREELKYFIKEFSNINIDKEFNDSIKALEYIEKNKPDIIFLDISMPKLDGMALGHIVNSFEKNIDIIFITAHREHAIEAFEIEAFDYILKPYSEDRIISTLKRLEKNNYNKSSNFLNNKIALKDKGTLRVINIEEICYCKADERETLIYTKDNKFIEKSSISDFYSKLPKDKFFRTHRSFIVNLNEIKEIIPWFNNTFMVRIHGIEEEVPVSRNNVHIFKQLMNI